MISFFPTPYPDELLYSILARYHSRSTNISVKATSLDLFGTYTINCSFDLPSHIDRLVSNLPVLSSYDAESIIENYTLFPFYAPFLPPERASLVKNSMRSHDYADIHTRVGIMAGTIPTPKMFRFCLECLQEEVKKYGEPYWHRLHQIAGVMVCPLHKTFLQDSTVRIKGETANKFSAADVENCFVNPIRIKYSSRTFDKLVSLAQDAETLLKLKIEPKTAEWYYKKYQYSLIDKGIATAIGTVRQKRLIQGFIDFYGTEFLEAIHSRIDADSSSNWLSQIVRTHTKVFNPIRHLLLIRFLEQEVEPFFSDETNYNKPFGDGPWTCFNAASDHYLEKNIKSVSLAYCYEFKDLVGTFSCECGFIYSTRYPQVSQGDKRKLRHIKSFGLLWERKLKELLVKKKYSFKKIASELKVGSITIKLHAARLELISAGKQVNDKKVISKIANNTKSKSLKAKLVNKRRIKRKIFLEAKKSNPLMNKSELRRKVPGTFVWLTRHDREWLDTNSPSRRSTIRVNNRVNWLKRDNKILNSVQKAVNKCIKAKPPVRITVSLIERRTNLHPFLQRYLHKLPKTALFLSSCIQTNEDFQIRRVDWAANELLQSGKTIKAYMIMEKAGLKKASSERVARKIDNYVTSMANNN